MRSAKEAPQADLTLSRRDVLSAVGAGADVVTIGGTASELVLADIGETSAVSIQRIRALVR